MTSDSTTPPQQVPRAPTRRELYYRAKQNHDDSAVFLASFPTIILFWPVLVLFFLAGVLQATGTVNPVTLGWISTLGLVINFLVLVQDIDRKKFFILILLGVCSALGLWIASLKGMDLVQPVISLLSTLRPTISSDVYFMVSTALLAFVLWGSTLPLFHYWRLEANEFVYYSYPEGRSLSIARADCTVSREIPDMLEYFLTGFGGTLLIKRDGEVIASIPRVPFLSAKMEALDVLLSNTRVTLVAPTIA